MLRLAAILLFILVSLNAFPQNSTNDWIDYSAPYFKIPVAQNSIYKVSYNDLLQAGFPVHSDPRNYRMFHRGVEQAISIPGQDDGAFDIGDYLLFYGQRNDGALDQGLYGDPADQPHKYYNLFSDSTSYFLTASASAGKRMDFFQKSNPGLPTEQLHYEERLLVLTESYNPAQSIRNEIFTSTFDPNESWTSHPVREGTSRTFVVEGLKRGVTSAGRPEIEIVVMGRTPYFHRADISIGTGMRLLKSLSFELFERQVIHEQIEWSDIAADGTLSVRLSVGSNGYSDQISLSYIKVKFPQASDAFNVDGKIINTAGTTEEVYVQVENVPAAVERIYDITDPSNVSIIGTTRTGTLNAVIPNATIPRKLLLSSQQLVPSSIKKVNFRSFTPGSTEYLIITHPRLRKPTASYPDPVEAFASYRASTEGGGFSTLIVHTQELYDQFSYGETTPLAIYRFLQYMSSSTNPPQYLFLIGKGLEIGYQFHRQANGSTWPYQDLVPTGGYPGSDMVFSVGLNGSEHEEGIPTGRLTAMNPEQVARYLDKVKELESHPANAAWKKNILHLSGGVEEGEPERFRKVLSDYETIAKGPYLGGNITALAKKSRDLELVNVSEQVNSGVGLITFFGHSSPNGFDFDLGFVTEPVLGYKNKGKYPIMLMNGCEAGAFFLTDTIFAENWVYARDKGAAAFIAHNSYATADVLSAYSHRFYEVAFGDSAFFGKSLGVIRRETARIYIDRSSTAIGNMSQIQQMILLGDPALKLNYSREPDLAVHEEELSVVNFQNTQITSLTDSFAIRMIVRNYGMARGDTFAIEVERVFPDNTTITYDSILILPNLSDTVDFIIRRGSKDPGGTNTFRVVLDPENRINEIDETNNIATLTLDIPLNGTRNVLPSEFAIVHDRNTRLIFQTTDLFADRRNLTIQVDTVHTFNSPFLKEAVVDAEVIGAYEVLLADKDSTTYYWRTRLTQPLTGESIDWTTTSFSYIENSPDGWAQIDFPQFLDNNTVGLVPSDGASRFEFENSVTSLDVITYGASAGKVPKDVSVKVGGAEYNLFAVNNLFKCRDNTINFIAFDKQSATPYAGIYLKWHEQFWNTVNLCGREPVVINSFMLPELDRGGTRDVFQYVNNIAEGDSVLMFNIGNAAVDQWPANVKAKLAELGISSAQLDGFGPGDPIVILGRKGSAPGSARIFNSSSPSPNASQLVVNETISGAYDRGTITTPLIGPAQEWQEVFFSSKEHEDNDKWQADLIGVRANGSSAKLLGNIGSSEDLSGIDAEEFPYVRLRLSVTDSIFLSPVQLSKWIVLFTPEPEGILLPDHSKSAIVLNEGERWIESYRFVNLSEQTFKDSLEVSVRIFNKTRSSAITPAFRIKAPAPSDTTRFSLNQSTVGLSGINDVQVYVNPRVLPEQKYDNNLVQKSGYLDVKGDRFAPVIDVTFDDRYLINGDFVSTSPLIRMIMWDGNTQFLKADTTDISVFLTVPCDVGPCPTRNVWLGRPDVSWSPATQSKPFTIEYRPPSLADGDYALRVEAADASGNAATPYSINFKVSSNKSYYLFGLHPNPFDTRARFGFQLTADGTPLSYTLQVMDITGRNVFTRTYTGPFNVGTNMFEWDGTDNAGNALSPGIYPYRLILNDNGKILYDQGKLVIGR